MPEFWAVLRRKRLGAAAIGGVPSAALGNEACAFRKSFLFKKKDRRAAPGGSARAAGMASIRGGV